MVEKYIKPHTSAIVLNVVIKMSATLLELALPAILAYMLDELVISGNREGIIFWGIVMLVVSFVAWVGNIVANRMASYTAAVAIRNIRHDLFERAMNLSARQIDELTVSSLETRLTTDTYNLHRFLGASLRMGSRSIMLFVGGVAFCFVLDWRLALILLVMVPPIFIIIRSVFNRLMVKFRHLQKVNDDMVQVIRENIRGIRVSKALDKTEYEKGRYAVTNEDLKAAEVDVTDHMAIIGPSLNTILYIGQVLVIAIGAYLASQGITQAGTITAFLSYFLQIANSLLTMNRMFNILTRARTSAERISEVLYTYKDKNQIIHKPVVDVLPEPDPSVPEIEFKNVSFTYTGANEDLEDISFKIYPGEGLGLIGATGSGKSTIIRLLLRQYDVTKGEILYRGINIKNITSEALHKQFGLVFQNDFLFGGTIRSNIDFGRGFTDENINEGIENAQATEFISEKEGGLKHRLASRGVNLSGGQKQRVLLSRALSGDPEVLILDDSSSALDFKTDANLRRAIQEKYSNITSIIVAQRVSSIMYSENILVVKNGRIAAAGTHDELIESSPEYAEIAGMQLGGNRIGDEESVNSTTTAGEVR